MAKSQKLKKELSFLKVYAIGTGATLSGGLFLLPGIAAAEAGPAVTISYILAAIFLLPAMFSLMELATAMPRSGGAYYFIDRSMGPMCGTIGGIGTWLSLVLKAAFALIGVGAYLDLFIAGDHIKLFAIGFTLFFGFINLRGAKESGVVQVYLVATILLLLTGFITNGLHNLNDHYFNDFYGAGATAILSTSGLVFMSYIGLTKIASIAEEIHNPEKTIPYGMLLSFLTSIIVYGLGIYVLVGVVPMNQLTGSLTPVADAANELIGKTGQILITVAAICAFFSVANAGILVGSRFPMAMSRDHLISKQFKMINKKGIPINGVILTVLLILFCIIFLNPLKIAKLTSALQLVVFAFCCLAVIIMRESRIEAYDPGYKSPFYPWMQIAGVVISVVMIAEMGLLTILFSSFLLVFCVFWYKYYASKHVARKGAILHVFQRLGEYKHEGLEPELRGILKEKGLRENDPFDEVVAQARVVELDSRERFDEVLLEASRALSDDVLYPSEKIYKELLEGTKLGGTPIERGVALPHIRLPHIGEPDLIIVRCKKGIDINIKGDFWGEHKPDGPIYAVFFLVSPEENPKQHLRILAKLAGRVDDRDFIDQWLKAKSEQELKELLLRDEHFISVKVKTGKRSEKLKGKALSQIQLPADTLIGMINRKGRVVVPKGSTVLEEDDRLTIIGEPNSIKEFKEQYGGK